MKLIPLSQCSKTNSGKYFAIVDDEDYDFLMQWKWSAVKTKYTVYAKRCQYPRKNQKTISMHRVILGLMGITKGDHKDHNGLNNQRYNLRESTHAQNCCNRRKRNNLTSKYIGVCWKAKNRKWCAAIKKNGKVNYLGLFNSEIEAARAYDEKARELHGEFACLNF